MPLAQIVADFERHYPGWLQQQGRWRTRRPISVPTRARRRLDGRQQPATLSADGVAAAYCEAAAAAADAAAAAEAAPAGVCTITPAASGISSLTVTLRTKCRVSPKQLVGRPTFSS